MKQSGPVLFARQTIHSEINDMPMSTLDEKGIRARNLLFLSNPKLWSLWPFLPLMRRQDGKEEFGVLYDALHVSGTPGFSATVILANVFALPRYECELLCLPREVFDTVEEVYLAGWRVD